MTINKFRIFYQIFGGAVQSSELNAHTPEQAVRFLREIRAGQAVYIKKIKHLGEVNVGPNADNHQSNVTGNDHIRRYSESV